MAIKVDGKSKVDDQSSAWGIMGSNCSIVILWTRKPELLFQHMGWRLHKKVLSIHFHFFFFPAKENVVCFNTRRKREGTCDVHR